MKWLQTILRGIKGTARKWFSYESTSKKTTLAKIVVKSFCTIWPYRCNLVAQSVSPARIERKASDPLAESCVVLSKPRAPSTLLPIGVGVRLRARPATNSGLQAAAWLYSSWLTAGSFLNLHRVLTKSA